ncbi:MAG: hypothetical protein QXK06_02235 [Candidatus Diapherotrites archaeon]
MVDIGNVITFSFAWHKNMKFLKYFFLLLLLHLAFWIVFVLAFLAFFGEYLSLLFSNPDSLLQSLALDWSSSAFLYKIIFYILTVFVISLLFLVFEVYVHALIFLFAFQEKGFSTAPFGFNKVLGLIGLGIISFFAALFYSFDESLRKWHWLSLAGLFFSILLMLMLFFSPLLFVFGLLLFLPCFLFYLYFVLVNSLRMTASMAIFLQEEKGVVESLKESFNLTKGHLIEIFVCNLAIAVIVGVVSSIFVFVFGSLLGFALLPFLPPIQLPFNVPKNFVMTGLEPGGNTFNPSFFVGEQFASLLFSPFSFLIGAFAAIGIYSELLKDREAASMASSQKASVAK